MKFLLVFMTLLFSLSCKFKQPFLAENSTATSSENCPETGTCSLEVLQNKNLKILKDNLGMIYPEVVNGNQLVLKFKFEKTIDLTAADSHYIEEVFIEMDPDNLQKDPTHLNSDNLLFARLCFCRGQTGYYRINSGKLSVKHLKGNTYKIDFDFKIDEVPQVIRSISQIFAIK